MGRVYASALAGKDEESFGVYYATLFENIVERTR